jgi:hypothetical protein
MPRSTCSPADLHAEAERLATRQVEHIHHPRSERQLCRRRLVGWQGHHDDLLDEIAKFDAGPGAGDSSEDSVTRRRKDEEERIPCVSTSRPACAANASRKRRRCSDSTSG